MANFKSVFTAIIDADGGPAVRELGKVSQAADKANTAAGKSADGLKSKISGFASSLTPAALTGGLVAAGAAIGAFALKSVSAFENLGVEVGKFSDSTGIAADQSSKFIELAKDLGIDAGALEGAIGKMNKTAGNTPGVFAAAGIQIARTKDGAVDANGTFLNTVQVLSSIEDPAKRAALASQIFGKSYQNVAEIIFNGTGQIQKSFDSISKQKVFDDAKIKKARDLRASFDTLHDSIEDVQLSLGEALAPAIAKAAEAIGHLVEEAAPLAKFGGGQAATAIESTARNINYLGRASDFAKDRLGPLGFAVDGIGLAAKHVTKQFTDPIGAFTDYGKAAGSAAHSIKNLFTHEDEAKKKTDQLAAANKAAGDRYAAMAASTYDAEQAAQAFADAQPAETAQKLADADKAAADQAQRLADINNQAADAITGRVDAQRAATDSTFALQKADRDFNETNAASLKTLADKNSTFADMADAIDNTRNAAIDLSDSAVKMDADFQTAAGGSQSLAEKIDVQNTSFLRSAKTASGPLRQSIIDYVSELNDIPPEKKSEIQALIDQGKVDEANRVLADASRTRSAAINADAYTSAAEIALNNVARTRVARIEAAIAAGGSQNSGQRTGHFASGGVAHGLSIVGENGPELINVGSPSRVFTARETAAMGGGINIVVNAGWGADGNQIARQVVEVLRNYQRTNGPLPIKVAA